MSVSNGTGIGDVEVRGMAIGDKEIAGLAIGDQIVFEVGADIYSMPVEPTTGERNTPITFTAHVNKYSEGVITYTVGSGGSLSGLSRSIKSVVEMPDGTRQITFTVTFGSRGTRTMRTFATTQQGQTDRQSVSYIDSAITIS